MKLSQIKEILKSSERISFTLPNGDLVASHFHVTEVGKIQKEFIDCGGTLRQETVANFQLWDSDDYDHRLHPDKLLKIIELSQKVLKIEDLEIEVEYQGDTIGKYGLDHNQNGFILTSKRTDCLAKDNCGIPNEKEKVKLSDLTVATSCCGPGDSCC